MMLFLVIIVSLLVGSFVTCFGCRLFTDNFSFVQLLYGRSKCVSCYKELRWFMLIPVVSYLLLRGKCYFCNSKISLVYPIVELINCLVWIEIYLAYGIKMSALLLAMTYSIILINVVSDIRNYLASDIVSLLSVIFAFIFLCSTSESVISHLLYSLLAILIFYLVSRITSSYLGQESLGLGDVKGILAMLLLCSGPLYMIAFMFLIGVFGVWFGLLWNFYKQEKYMPYLPVMFFCSLQLSLLYEKL